MIQFIGKTNLLRGGNCFDVCGVVPFFTQWLFYKAINLDLNIIVLHHTHLSFLKKQETKNTYFSKKQQHLQAIFCDNCFSDEGKIKCYP